MAEKKIIQLATLEKQIEILDKIDFTKDEMLVAIGNEHGDIITILSQKIDSLIVAEDQKLIEQLARTLLANQSEASVQYVLSHELVGPVFKYILKSNNGDFDSAKINDVIVDNDMMEEIVQNDQLAPILYNSAYFINKLDNNSTASKLCGTSNAILNYVLDANYALRNLKNNYSLSKGIVSNNQSLYTLARHSNCDEVMGSYAFKSAVDDSAVLSSIKGDNTLFNLLLNKDKFMWAVAYSNIWFTELYQDKYMERLLSQPSAKHLSANNDKWADKLARKNNGWLTHLVDGTNKFKNAFSPQLVTKIQYLNTLRSVKVGQDGIETIFAVNLPSHIKQDGTIGRGGFRGRAKGARDNKDYTLSSSPLSTMAYQMNQLSKETVGVSFKSAGHYGSGTVYYYEWEEMA